MSVKVTVTSKPQPVIIDTPKVSGFVDVVTSFNSTVYPPLAPETVTGKVTVSPYTEITELKGDPGAPGPPGATFGVVTAYAGSNIGAQRPVYQQADSTFAYADSSKISDANLVFLLTQSSSGVGGSVEAINIGYMTEPSWNWQPGVVFLGQTVLTQVAPSLQNGDVFLVQVAVVVTPQTLFWSPSKPVILMNY